MVEGRLSFLPAGITAPADVGAGSPGWAGHHYMMAPKTHTYISLKGILMLNCFAVISVFCNLDYHTERLRNTANMKNNPKRLTLG